ncbi:MAG: tRNA1(Val) (adenine(37)-N6)-methyltransferase [Nitrospinaceae bacterium]
MRTHPSPLIIKQDIHGYRYSIEPFLLADFIQLAPDLRVLDIGTGCGIIPLLLATRERQIRITAVEIQESLYRAAAENISKNNLSGSARVIHGNFVALAPELDPEGFDLILSNPPYRKIKTGRINPNREKAIARHEIALSLESIVKHSVPLLKTAGRIALTYPPNRLNEVLLELRSRDLHPSRLRFVHGNRGAEAKIFLIEAVRERRVDCVVESPLFVYKSDNSYTEEMENIYASFNYTDRTDHLR